MTTHEGLVAIIARGSHMTTHEGLVAIIARGSHMTYQSHVIRSGGGSHMTSS